MLQNGTLIDCNIDELSHGKFKAVRDVALKVKKGSITAFIGPWDAASTVLRCLNRMNDLVRGLSAQGHVNLRGQDIYASRSIRSPCAGISDGIQQPNPFAMSIFSQRRFGLRLNRYKGPVADKVEAALRQAARVDEVKDKLRTSALALSGGQQQRLCIGAPRRHRAGRAAMDGVPRRSIRSRRAGSKS